MTVRWTSRGVRAAVLALACGGLALGATLPQAAVGAERAPSPPARAVLPVHDAVVLRLFDPPLERWGRGHRGVDLSVARAHEPVRSPAGGVVTWAGFVVDRGVVTITHDDGLRSSIEPVTEQAPVGTRVAAGDPVASWDATRPHCADPCVHWGVRDRAGEYVDPLTLLGVVRVRLLPATGSAMPAATAAAPPPGNGDRSGALALQQRRAEAPHGGRVHLGDP